MSRRQILCFVIIYCVVLCMASGSFAQTRGGSFAGKLEKALSTVDYHAMVIGVNRYVADPQIPNLDTSVNDARSVREVLIEKYGFPPENVSEIYDERATRDNILAALRELAISLGKNDALVIYFAGHGVEDNISGDGYWIPSDASPNKYSSYIANTDIRKYLKAIKARHIFLISDSCFSGSLLAQRAVQREVDERFYAEKVKLASRVVLTSGGNEPVMDSGKSGHSVFNYFFLKILRDNEKQYIIPTEIISKVGPLVANNSVQTPRWGSLREAWDEGGEIVLINHQFTASAFLSFQSNKKSKVYLNGVFVGDTPITSLEVQPGEHQYKLACSEYDVMKNGSVTASSGRTETINLQFNPPENGTLTVYSDPWAYVYLNGEKIGETPIIGMTLKPGRYLLKMENRDFQLLEGREILIKPGETTRIIEKKE